MGARHEAEGVLEVPRELEAGLWAQVQAFFDDVFARSAGRSRKEGAARTAW